MKKTEFKEAALAEAKAKHQSVIDDIKKRIDDLRNSEMNVNEDQLDLTEQAQNASNNTIISALANQLNFALDELNLLNRMTVNQKPNEEVSMGSVVKTDKKMFYVSASIEKFHVNGDELFGLSTHAPLYQAMKGKKAGEKFTFNEIDYKIKEVF